MKAHRSALILILVFSLALGLTWIAACSSSGDDDDDDEDDDDDSDVPEQFRDICGDRNPADTLEETVLQYDNGDAFSSSRHLLSGDIEVVHFVPEHPFLIQKIKIRFAGDAGTAIVHLYGDLGRSWPDEDNDLIDPVEIEVEEDQGWTEIDVSSHKIAIHPSEHFWIGYEHTAETPYLSIDDGSEGEGEIPSQPNHSRLKSQELIDQWKREGLAFIWAGLNNSYMIRAEGYTFCRLEEDQRQMREITASAGLEDYTHMRVAWGDVDNDGYDDLLLHRAGYQADMAALLANNGDGTFTDITDEAGINGYYTALGVFGDVDNDGDLDIYGGVYVPQGEGEDSGARSLMFINDGDGAFEAVEDAGVELEGTTSAAGFADYDGDGNLDLYVGNWLVVYPNIASFEDWLFRGLGDGTFVETTEAAGLGNQDGGRPCYGVSWGDYDNDGDQDIFVANYGRTDNFLWRNRGDGTFFDVGEVSGTARNGIGTGGNTFGADFGDYDNDGDLDLYLGEISHPRYLPSSDQNSLLKNLGSSEGWTFEDVREASDIDYDEGEIDPSWIDYDNDGDLDLFLSDLYPLHYARLLRQEEDHTFMDVTYLAGIWVHDATNHAWADFDRDGDLDLVVTRRSDGGHVHVFRNDVGNQNNWITVRLEGTDSNRSAIGARVKVVTGDLEQIREVQGGKGHFNSQPSLPVEFGLGQSDAVDGIRVTWPSGNEDEYLDVEVNRFVFIKEGASEVDYED